MIVLTIGDNIMSTYAQRLLEVTEDKYDFTDTGWIQFLKDHRRRIVATSSTLSMDPNIVNSYRYHLTDLLKEYKIDSNISWMVMWLNQLDGAWEVIDIEELIIPSKTEIESLWDKYKSYKNKLLS